MENLGALPTEERSWKWHTFASLWITMLTTPTQYSIGGSLVALGLSSVQALICTAVGSCFVTLAMILNSGVGVEHGIPFPVYARAAYGIQGAKYAALSRGLVGVLWLSFQLWISAESLNAGLERAWPGFRSWKPLWGPYLSASQLIVFFFVVMLHAVLISIGVRRFDRVPYALAPFCIALFALFVVWAVTPSWGGLDGFGEVLKVSADEVATVSIAGLGEGYISWIGGLNCIVSVWSTLMLNIADLSRFAPRQFDQAFGQVVGIPIPNIFMCAIGIICSATIFGRTGKMSWLPTDIFAFWPPWASVLGGVIMMLSLVSVNIGANIIPPANDFLNLFPTRLRWRYCAYSTLVFAVAACPWLLFHSPTGFAVRFISGYGMVTGAIYGVMVSDYYILRRQQLDLSDLYPEKIGQGAFQYWHGHNWRAILATIIGVALPFPAWVAELAGRSEDVPGFFDLCGKASWFVASLAACTVYLLACGASPPSGTSLTEGAVGKKGEFEEASELS